MAVRRPRPVRRTTRLVGVAVTTAALAASGLGPLGPGPATAAASPVATAASPDLRPTPLNPRRLQRRLDRVVQAGAVGAVAEVATPRGTWSGAAGRARLRPSMLADPDARFRAASVTKQTVAVLALQMVQRGRWTLGTTIGDVLPGLWPERSGVTLRQLLSHTSGMPDALLPLLGTPTTVAEFRAAIAQRRTDREIVGVARTLPWLFEPGTSASYSNTNYVVVGLMLKKATGRSMPALVRTRVLEPAGMTRSSFSTRPRMAPPRLREYAHLLGSRVDVSTFHPSMFSSAGALVSTAGDLNRFQRALSTGVLLERSLVRRMRAPVAEVVGVPYGLGSYRLPDPCRPGRWLHGHDGASWGTVTLSFTTPGGFKRVTASMTGRDLDGDPTSATRLTALVYDAFAQTCGGGVPGSGRPAGLDQRLLPRLAR